MNEALQEKLKQLPANPGVYFHKSASGEIIYVGKAAVLKNRVRQYFQDSRGRDNKTMALVAEIVDTDWVETESEVDALFLESEMVKRYAHLSEAHTSTVVASMNEKIFGNV